MEPESGPQVAHHNIYVWELNLGHFEWEVWREIDKPDAHKPGHGSAPTYLEAYDAAAACLRQELGTLRAPGRTIMRLTTTRLAPGRILPESMPHGTTE